MKIMHQYQPSGGSPAHKRDVFWLTPDGPDERRSLTTLTAFLKCSGVKVGWTGLDNEMIIIEFPVRDVLRENGVIK